MGTTSGFELMLTHAGLFKGQLNSAAVVSIFSGIGKFLRCAEIDDDSSDSDDGDLCSLSRPAPQEITFFEFCDSLSLLRCTGNRILSCPSQFVSESSCVGSCSSRCALAGRQRETLASVSARRWMKFWLSAGWTRSQI